MSPSITPVRNRSARSSRRRNPSPAGAPAAPTSAAHGAAPLADNDVGLPVPPTAAVNGGSVR